MSATIFLVGRLTRDAELKFTNGGQAICHFSVATSHRKKVGDQWTESPSYWECDLWGKQGESLNQYLTKGKMVELTGLAYQDTWEDQEGVKKTKAKVTIDRLNLISTGQGQVNTGPSQENASQGPNSSTAGRLNQKAEPQKESEDMFTDDIPF